MNVWSAVIVDLWQFLRSLLLPPTPEPEERSYALPLPKTPQPAPRMLSAAPPAPLSLGSTATVLESADIITTPVPVRLQPTKGFDNVVTTLPFGTIVRVIERSGQWVEIASGDYSGWVPFEAVSTAGSILPAMVDGVTYDARHTDTEAIRLCIDDEFAAGAAHLPLLSEEYVTYALWLGGKTFPWPTSYQRVAGTWHRKLKGVPGVHIGVSPRSGSVMEYVLDEVGYLAYVHVVTPDEQLAVAGVGLIAEGRYTELQLERAEWIERQPVFITVE